MSPGVPEGGEISHVRKLARSAVGRLLLSASATAMLQGGSLMLGFVTAVLLARLLGGEEYGRYVLALAWAGVLTTPAILGLDRFLVRGIAVYDVERNPHLIRGLLRRTNQLVLITSITIASLGCLAAIVLLARSLQWPFCVAMLLVPITAITLLRQGAMQAIGRVVTGQLPEYLIRPTIILAGVVALKLVGGGLLTSAAALGVNVVGVAVACVVGAVLLRRALPVVWRRASPEYTTRQWLRASLPMMLISGVWMANSYVTTLVVGTLDGARAAGVYSVVQRGAELIVIWLIAANMPLAPAVARMHARGDRQSFEHTTERVAQATLVVSIPLAAVLALFPGIYLGLFGAGFEGGATALTILALGQVVNAVAGPAGNVLIMTGYERVAVWGMVVGLIANFVLGVLLVPRLGVTGGAIAFASSLVLWNTILVILARRRIGVNVTAFPGLAVSKPAQGGV
jgi:O-antigen/teichoic acid export membrane protein